MNSIPKENYQSPLSSVPATLPTALPSYQTSYSVTHPWYHQIAQDELTPELPISIFQVLGLHTGLKCETSMINKDNT